MTTLEVGQSTTAGRWKHLFIRGPPVTSHVAQAQDPSLLARGHRGPCHRSYRSPSLESHANATTEDLTVLGSACSASLSDCGCRAWNPLQIHALSGAGSAYQETSCMV